MNIFNFLLPLLLFTAATGCNTSTTTADRAAAVQNNREHFVVGLACGTDEPSTAFADGARLRAREINATGGIQGRTIRLVEPDTSSQTPAALGQALLDVPDMAAAITRLDREAELTLSVMLQYHGMIMLSGSGEGTELTTRGFDKIFRAVPADTDIARTLASFCRTHKLVHVAVLHAPDRESRDIADAFEKASLDAGLDISTSILETVRPSAKTDGTFRLLSLQQKPDAFFPVLKHPQWEKAVTALRREEPRLPILLMPSAGRHVRAGQAPTLTEPLYTIAFLPPQDRDERYTKFETAFRHEYGRLPTAAAARGYDAMALLAQGARQAGSPTPDALSRSLPDMSPLKGIAGNLTFGADRSLTGSRTLILQHTEGAWSLFPQ